MADEVQKVPTRDEIRAAIFADKKLQREEITLFGQKIELRQPRLSDIISIQTESGGERQSAIVQALIRYAFVPGTEIPVFEEGDMDSFMSMPFGQDLVDVSNALERLTKVNFQDTNDSSGKT